MTLAPPSQKISPRLTALRRALLWRAVIRNVLWSCGGLAVVALGLALGDWRIGLTEGLAALALSLALAAAVLALVIGHVRAVMHLPTRYQLALAVEAERPELMDAFVCAVGLENAQRPLRRIESELLADMQGLFATDEIFWRDFRRRHLRLPRLVAQVVAALLLLTIAGNSRVVQKARYGLGDFLRGADSGLRVQPGDHELPTHSDAAVHAEVLRWDKDAWIDYRESADGELLRSPMTATPDGRMLFTFYDLGRDVRYRVGTAALRSRWYRLVVFEPPRCLEVMLATRPLPYTGREAQEYNAFQDLKVVSGETLHLRVRIPNGCQAELHAGEQRLPLKAAASDGDGDGWRDIDHVIRETTLCQIVLTDAAGHEGREAPFTVTAEPDLPPIVELRQPALDSQIKPGDSLRLELFAGDDFGLSQLTLHYAVNGGERRQLLLRQAPTAGAGAAPAETATPTELEWQYSELWDLPAAGLKDGDLLSCYVVVADNRQPDPQTARTEIFFVVVRPEPESIDGEGNGGQEQKGDIADLLAEAKRLLRLTWDAMQQVDADRARSSNELLRDLKQLELDVRSRFHDMQEEAQGMMGEPFTTLFDRASQELLEAVKMVERSLLEEGIAPQERALAALTQIENEMVKNAMRSKKAKSGKEQGESESEEQEQPPDSQQQQQQSQSQQEKIDRMKKQREALQRLIGRQEEINRDSSRPDASAAALAGKQGTLHDDTGDLRRDLQAMPESKDAAEALHRATREMDNGKQAFGRDDLRSGGIHGTRSLAALVSALRSLEDALRNASANQIAQLAQRADQLSQEQQDAAQTSAQAAQATQPPDDTASKAMRERQTELKQQSNELMQAISQAAEGLQDDYPEAAKALQDAAEQSRQRELPAHQQRAINALLYKRYERARKDQIDASNYLQALATDLQNASAQLPPIGEQDLREALQQLGEQAEKVSQAMQDQNQQRASQQIDKARQGAADMLQRLADASKDPRLQQLSDDLRLPTGEASPSAAGAETIARFRAAAAVLAQHLEKLLVERKLAIRRQVSPPPAKYQRLVEEYFKSLGRE